MAPEGLTGFKLVFARWMRLLLKVLSLLAVCNLLVLCRRGRFSLLARVGASISIGGGVGVAMVNLRMAPKAR